MSGMRLLFKNSSFRKNKSLNFQYIRGYREICFNENLIYIEIGNCPPHSRLINKAVICF